MWSLLFLSHMDFCGTLFYHFHNDWPWSQGFFYTCVSGFSVGFGKFPVTTNSSRWYTFLNVLIGASLIAGALGLFVEIMLERGDAVLEEEKRAMHHSKVATKLEVITPKPSLLNARGTMSKTTKRGFVDRSICGLDIRRNDLWGCKPKVGLYDVSLLCDHGTFDCRPPIA